MTSAMCRGLRGCTVTSLVRPPRTVLAAFGLVGPAVRLSGGQGTSWRVGEVVLKPHVDAAFQEWLGTQFATVQQRGFQLPTVLRAVGGDWVVHGWGGLSRWFQDLPPQNASPTGARSSTRPDCCTTR